MTEIVIFLLIVLGAVCVGLSIIVFVLHARALRQGGRHVMRTRSWHIVTISLGFLCIMGVAISYAIESLDWRAYVLVIGLVLSAAALGVLGDLENRRVARTHE